MMVEDERKQVRLSRSRLVETESKMGRQAAGVRKCREGFEGTKL